MEDQFTAADTHFFIDCHWLGSVLSTSTGKRESFFN